MTIINGYSDPVARASAWLAKDIIRRDLNWRDKDNLFENRFNCRIVNDPITDKADIVFDNNADATAFLLRWS